MVNLLLIIYNYVHGLSNFFVVIAGETKPPVHLP